MGSIFSRKKVPKEIEEDEDYIDFNIKLRCEKLMRELKIVLITNSDDPRCEMDQSIMDEFKRYPLDCIWDFPSEEPRPIPERIKQWITTFCGKLPQLYINGKCYGGLEKIEFTWSSSESPTKKIQAYIKARVSTRLGRTTRTATAVASAIIEEFYENRRNSRNSRNQVKLFMKHSSEHCHTYTLISITKSYSKMGSTFTRKKVTITPVDPEVKCKIDKYLMNTKAILIIKSNCSRCKMAQKILNNYGLSKSNYYVLNINDKWTSPKVRTNFQTFCGDFPKLFINGECYGGLEEIVNLDKTEAKLFMKHSSEHCDTETIISITKYYSKMGSIFSRKKVPKMEACIDFDIKLRCEKLMRDLKIVLVTNSNDPRCEMDQSIMYEFKRYPNYCIWDFASVELPPMPPRIKQYLTTFCGKLPQLYLNGECYGGLEEIDDLYNRDELSDILYSAYNKPDPESDFDSD
ncbi:hypothetical protein RDWZM_010394 [Blomia tropicalis]|uniref:Glutaredoxin domain-containing protein n=1 Tax=Blomia tropicalis TaxID=40697 RepID=A0A9Q0LYP5_BLOTA|nr:hypothetical protein RDWZM_010394 [Blomia tropicalis]